MFTLIINYKHIYLIVTEKLRELNPIFQSQYRFELDLAWNLNNKISVILSHILLDENSFLVLTLWVLEWKRCISHTQLA